ncbi:energy transducer TonB [Falsiruegeria mediterranea]
MQTGTKISAIAHVTLVGWAFLGGAFRSEPLPFDVQDVSVISSEEFAALSAPVQTPEVAQQPDALQQPETPEVEVAVPEAPQPESEPEQQQPEPVVEPTPEPLPEPVVEVPDPQVSEDTAVLVQPDPEPAIDLNPPGKRPKPRPVERVAPQPVALPPPDAQPDEVETPPVVAEEGAEEPQPEQEQTAPEEATDQIVTEAEDSDELAPLRSPRPPARRPSRPTQTAEQSTSQPASPSGVQDALAEALTGSQEDIPLGPPLTGGEKDGLRLAMSRCWNVGALSSEALQTTVIVAFSMQRDGKPDAGSIRMLDSSGGSASSAQQAYQAARRAIIRCGAKGYDLPAEKYGQWRDIEVTFNPERMRIK